MAKNGDKGFQILRASNVEVPLTAAQPAFDPEVLKLRSDFLAGRELSPDDLRRVVQEAAEGGNGNCNIC
jgi:hypothetical protein